MVTSKTFAEYVDGSRIRFFYPCGHVEVRDYSRGIVTKRMSEWAARRMASWWSREKGGVHAPCPKCATRRGYMGKPGGVRVSLRMGAGGE